ncbi:uncharacterized protein LOC129737688 [Uranotaenia lowii]|uniref:uncharacterized protein LOC129737688 n=1 Tax=Uranotaenia lowii TaxID=190385 RepID=UPI002478488A|nr:uncharacterized protein LOC129737688 [Uranotaenia lowii]
MGLDRTTLAATELGEIIHETVGFNCQICEQCDNSRMVLCDHCSLWHHYGCVGVTDEVEGENVPWSCKKCEKKLNRTHKGPKEDLPLNNPGPSKLIERKELQLQFRKQPEAPRASKVGSVSSRGSAKSLLEIQLRKVEAEQEILEEKRKLMEKRFSLLEEIAELEESNSVKDDQQNMNDVNKWLQESVSPSKIQGSRKHGSSCSSNQSSESETSTDTDSSEADSVKDEPSKRENFRPHKQSTPKRISSRPIKSGKAEGTTRSNRNASNLDRSHIAARQVIRDLPVFTGNPEDWPMFVSTYESTTNMCHFNDEENLIRLRNCLKGDALNAVRSFLIHPSTVPKVLNALRLRFGQPQFVIGVLEEKIRAMPNLKVEYTDKLIDFSLAVQNLSATIDACGKKEYSRDTSLLKYLVGKLPEELKMKWARHQRSRKKVNLAKFSDWLYTYAEDACVVTEPTISKSRPADYGSRRTKASLHTHVESVDSDYESPHEETTSTLTHHVNTGCPLCKGSCVSLEQCSKFRGKTYGHRWNSVREKGICRKCLKRHRGRCVTPLCGQQGCTYKHHALLHKYKGIQPQVTAENPSCNTHQVNSGSALLRYVPVKLYGNGKELDCFAFLDDGSHLTLLDEEVANTLGIFGEKRPLYLKWTGGTERHESDSRVVNLQISGRSGKKHQLDGVRTVRKLQLPYQTLDFDDMKRKYNHLRDLPVDSYQNARPQILIGIQHVKISLVQKSREGNTGGPVAFKTRLGWSVYGGSTDSFAVSMVHCYFHTCSSGIEEEVHLDNKLNQALTDYFALESIGITTLKDDIRSKEDERALKILNNKTRLTKERYETGLLWRYDHIRLPNNESMARRRYEHLEKRMKQNPELKRMLTDKIADYIAKGYVEKLVPSESTWPDQHPVWYLPIFPITNPNKPGKIRVVWDAAASYNGISLNSVLLTGPDQLASLVTTLIKFREHRFAVSGDLCEMFHQVIIREPDRQCQRFFWKDQETDEEPSKYVMKVMTFGARCSPSSAQFVKDANAERFSKQFPVASNIIKYSTYVDDVLFSVESEDKAIEIAKNIRTINAAGGFQTHNWMSNSRRVLMLMGEQPKAEKSLEFIPGTTAEKVLGMFWCTETDCFTFKINWSRLDSELLNLKRVPTKREVLKTLMSIYDPLGLVSHYLMFLKILLQEIWRAKVEWDETIGEEFFKRWTAFISVLPSLENLRIPRCYHLMNEPDPNVKVQLHTFVDASQDGMAALTFLRYESNDAIYCSLVGSKTRVAPLKYLSIPRMELQAGVVGARLTASIKNSLTIKIQRTFLWTDSRNALSWILSDHRMYSLFVAARVSEILEITCESDWRWVPTKWNVADDGTRWQRQSDLSPTSRWFVGPSFLRQSESTWPIVNLKKLNTHEELKVSLHIHCEKPEAVFRAEDFSKWKRLVRVTAYVLRYLRKLRRAGNCGVLKREELQLAEELHYRQAQVEVYEEEYRSFEAGVTVVSKRSPIYKLSAFMDEKKLLRMDGRTGACKYLDPETVNPIILPSNHALTKLIVASYHDKYHHQNRETIVNEIRQKFYIANLRRVCNEVRSNCQHCKNRYAEPRPPKMYSLPPSRLAAHTRPFTHTGIDYFGPLEVVVGRKTEKRWGALFVCLTTRAIHLEVAYSLTSSSCIMVVRSFIARRGSPAIFYSDRGTNFIGAHRELKEALSKLNHDSIAEEFISSDTDWIFNTPASPHMGGSWERLVRSVKRILPELQVSRKPNDEELRNAFAEIEATLNRRPLTHVPVDYESCHALTPNHFLLGSSDGSKPLTDISDDSTTLKRGWLVSQAIANQFWKRWLRDYLPEITRRTKWYEPVKPIEVNDIVVIADPDLPRDCWPKGRVIKTTSRDGQVRRAWVQTCKSIYERPAVKIAVLDVGVHSSKPSPK